jgi:hypothetical protein
VGNNGSDAERGAGAGDQQRGVEPAPGVAAGRGAAASAAKSDGPRGCSLISVLAVLTGVACGAWCADLAAGWWGWWAAPPVFVVTAYVATYVPGLPVGMIGTVLLLTLMWTPRGSGGADA